MSSETIPVQTTSYSLNELLDRARGGTLTIPRFQRKFTWKLSQTTLLVDSMSRSYPIGSLLLLSRNSELELNARSIEAEIRSSEDDNQMSKVEDEYYILDGQQRLTSIARVFLNADPKKCYYFDLKKMLDSHEGGEDSWISCPRRGKSTPERRDKKRRLLRADIALKQATADIYVSEYIEDSGDFSEFSKNQSREAAAKIKGIFETIRNYKVPAVIVERNSNIESVCRIFEKVNSTGTRLKTFDLAVARFYPKPDLRKLWSNTQERYSIFKDFEVDGERILQVLFLVVAVNKGKDISKYIEPTRSNLLGLKSEEINKEWERSSEALAKTYEFAQDQGARPETLPRHSLLVSLAAVRSLIFHDQGVDPWHKHENHDFIRRWYFSKVMQASRAQSSNYQISQDFKALLEYARTGKRPETPPVILDAERLLKLPSGDVRYKSLQNIFAITLRQDLWSGNIINTKSQLHDHHIFPKNAGKKHGLNKSMLDSICNRVPMLASQNQSLGEGYPQEYLKKIADRARNEGTLGDFKRRMRDCLIPGDPGNLQWADSFSTNRFEEFCRKRAALIVERVGEIVGCPLQKVSPSSDDEIEDDDD